MKHVKTQDAVFNEYRKNKFKAHFKMVMMQDRNMDSNKETEGMGANYDVLNRKELPDPKEVRSWVTEICRKRGNVSLLPTNTRGGKIGEKEDWFIP